MKRNVRQNRTLFIVSLALVLASTLSACVHNSQRGGYLAGDNAPRVNINHEAIPNAVPKVEPRSQYGNPATYSVNGKTYHTMSGSLGFIERGTASWYGTKFHGRLTSSRDTYNIYEMTAAHKSLPLPTYVEVTNLDNGKSIIVKVNDRGPFHDDRVIDLSYVAALKLDIVKSGTGRVEIRAIDPKKPLAHRKNPKPKGLNPDVAVAIPLPEPTAFVSTPIVDSPPAPNLIAGLESSQPFFLQVGAFSSFLNADNLRNRIVPVTNSNVVISKITANDQSVYRVRIGPISTEQDAVQLALKLTEHGMPYANVVYD
ncbi:septal ring lytic transglycosylase RlpA family protein [Pseudomonadota bacterium]